MGYGRMINDVTWPESSSSRDPNIQSEISQKGSR